VSARFQFATTRCFINPSPFVSLPFCSVQNSTFLIPLSPVFPFSISFYLFKTQHLAVDGREFVRLRLPPTGLEENFTRAYYNSSGTLILSGSSEEQVLRLHCSQTGRTHYL
jgi:hypothetical protein